MDLKHGSVITTSIARHVGDLEGVEVVLNPNRFETNWF